MSSPIATATENLASTAEPLRDDIEFVLLDTAITDAIPVVGICRGLQLLNVHQGGTLEQHVPEHSRYDVLPHEHVHDIATTPGSVLHTLYGTTTRVNSLHHQTVATLGAGLTATATAEDGTIEGVEMANAAVIAVQWHPEMMDVADPAFGWLVARARERIERCKR